MDNRELSLFFPYFGQLVAHIPFRENEYITSLKFNLIHFRSYSSLFQGPVFVASILLVSQKK